MANDMDMFRDIEEYERLGDRIVKILGKKFKASEIAEDLAVCYSLRYGNESGSKSSLKKAEKCKVRFQKKYGIWHKYY